jgi:hypothetical protein
MVIFYIVAVLFVLLKGQVREICQAVDTHQLLLLVLWTDGAPEDRNSSSLRTFTLRCVQVVFADLVDGTPSFYTPGSCQHPAKADPPHQQPLTDEEIAIVRLLPALYICDSYAVQHA